MSEAENQGPDESPPPPGQGLLFDLPLESPRPRRRRPAAPAEREVEGGGESPPVASRRSRDAAASSPRTDPLRARPGPSRPGPQPAPVAARWRAAVADLLLHAALVILVAAGLSLLEIPLGLRTAPPIAIFLVVFSLVYTVVPLALWGHTPGMAWVGLIARRADGGAPDFGEAGRRWLGSALTLAGLGLPLLLPGLSLADRLSGTEVIAVPGAEL